MMLAFMNTKNARVTTIATSTIYVCPSKSFSTKMTERACCIIKMHLKHMNALITFSSYIHSIRIYR